MIVNSTERPTPAPLPSLRVTSFEQESLNDDTLQVLDRTVRGLPLKKVRLFPVNMILLEFAIDTVI